MNAVMKLAMLTMLWGLVVLAILFQFAAAFRARVKRLRGSVTSAGVYKFEERPAMTLSDMLAIIFSLLCKYLPGRTPVLIPNKANDGFLFSPLGIQSPFSFNASDVRRFNESVNAEDLDSLSNPLLLPALTEFMVLLLVSHPECPLKPIGAVNTTNTFKLLRPAAELLDKSMTIFAEIDWNGVRTMRGVEVTVHVELVLYERVVFKKDVSFLQFLEKSVQPLYKPFNASINEPKPKSDWRTTNDIVTIESSNPWKWAAVCKDYNPIHTIPFLARLLGFKNVIAHGNHAVALLLAKQRIEATNVVVKFVKPMILPIRMGVRQKAGEWRLVGEDGKARVEITYS